jgi:pyruvate-formate lyase-activating enzyme
MLSKATLPDGFDPSIYVSLHPDLISAGVEGREHYLAYGFYEGRHWRKQYTFYIDVFSHCNLRCPSCLVGSNFGDIALQSRGLMSPQLLGAILDKAKSECDIRSVGLFNWTEPLLNPKLPELVREVKSRNLVCSLSSNLNKLLDPERLLAEHPDHFRISLSGFSQPIYEIGHREGQIEVVKHNMERLAKAHSASASKTQIEVHYHLYRHNIDEAKSMKVFAESHGFAFTTNRAYLTIVEKIIEFSEGRSNQEDLAIINQLLLPLDRALEVTSREQRTKECDLLEDVVVLDVKGNAMLCCGSSMQPANVVGNFLQMPLTEIQKRRRQKSLCGTCMKLGLPDYFHPTSPELERLTY